MRVYKTNALFANKCLNLCKLYVDIIKVLCINIELYILKVLYRCY